MSTKSSTTGRGQDRGRGGGVLTPGRITMLVVAALSLVFIFENTRETKIRLLIPEVTMPLWLALLAMAVVGALCGYFFGRRR
ncbi:LapA family protein [Streptomyces sp. NPDC002073]|uniref:LapA family protein n=1 Tax=Streptomyces sp. NBC_00239 TaxID=2903640 RepID=UPI002E2C787E|nr:LapA family protein [Streptomyces sp. NBC_00239]